MTGNPEIGTRLAEFAKLKFGSKWGWQKQFAAALGMDPGSTRKYLLGQTIPGSRVQQKLRGMGCRIEWLMTGKGSMVDPQEREFRRIVRETISDPGGNMPAVASEPSYTYIPLTVAKPEDVRAIAVPDDSMAGSVWTGDTIFVRREQGCDRGDLCLVETTAGKHKIRHVYISSDTVLLTATNAPPEQFAIADIASINSVIAATIEGVHLRGK